MPTLLRAQARGVNTMRLLTCTFLAIALLLNATGKCETIHTLILKGKLSEARDLLSRHATASTRDGATLFFQSLLESDGSQSVRLMKAALETPLASRYREQITYRLAQYYFLEDNYRELSRLIAEYRSQWEKGEYQAEMGRFSILADEHDQAHESALRQCDRWLVKNSSDKTKQWGLIDKARIMAGHGKRVGATKILRQLSRSRKGEGVPQSLYLLGRDAVARNRADDAIFYYNILREGYPDAVGLDELMTGLGEISARATSDSKAEKLTGTYYSIKVGVFSKRGNARRQADIFKAYDKKIEIKTRKISGKDYRVVYVGRFQNYDDAVRFKLQLEANHHEVFQVVTR